MEVGEESADAEDDEDEQADAEDQVPFDALLDLVDAVHECGLFDDWALDVSSCVFDVYT